MSTPRPSDKQALTQDTVLASGAETQPRTPDNAGAANSDGGRVEGFPLGLRRGSTLGRYIVLDRLGSGGMGVVFSAFDPELDRKVAVKVLNMFARKSKRTAGRVRLLREAQSLAKLSHPNTIAVYDVGTLGDSVFLAMEFVAGSTLRAWVAQKRRLDAAHWRVLLEMYTQAGRGLAAAHAAGIVHRDFKPENVMVDTDDRARVLDFGLARPARDTTSSSGESAEREITSGTCELRLTATGAVMGTPFYMAPEQHRGDPVDERADQFSFCVALWEALYGERPFRGTSLPDLARCVVGGELEEPPRGTGTPPWVRRALERGLATDPDDRFATMGDLLAELSRDPGGRRRMIGIGAAMVVLPTAALVAALFVSREEPPCQHPEQALEAVWGPEARARVREAFIPVAEADGAEAFGRVAAEVDAYTDQWIEQRRDACEAARVRNDQSETTLELRYACLDERAYRLETLVDVLAAADKEAVFRAPALVQGLPPAADCGDVATLRRAVPPPDDPATRRTVADIRRRVHKAKTLAETGRLDEVRAELDALVVAAEATGYAPVKGDVLVVRGHVLMFSGDAEGAQAALEEAQLIAEAEGYDALIVETLLWMAALDGMRRNAFDMAHRHIRRAKAVLQRAGNPEVHWAQVHLTTARIYSIQKKPESSAAAYEAYLSVMRQAGREDTAVAVHALGAYGHQLASMGRTAEAEKAVLGAVTRARTVLGAGHPELAAVLIYRARMLSGAGRDREALTAFAEAREIYGEAYGADHSNVGAVLNDEATVLHHLGRFGEAIAKYEQAGPIILETYGEDNVQYAIILTNMASLLLDVGQPTEAMRRLERAAEIRAEHHGRDTSSYAYVHDLIGDAHAALGHLPEARAAYNLALAILAGSEGPESKELAHPELGLGDLDFEEGSLTSAAKRYAHALMLLEGEEQPNDVRRARARFGQARVMVAQGRDPDEALELAQRARHALLEQPEAVRHLREVESWLAER